MRVILLRLLLPLPMTILLVSCNAGLVDSNRAAAPANPSTPSSAKATPVITWPQPATITNPAPLTSTQLDATANVAGTFAYSPAAGTVLAAGTQTLTATFTPADTADYNTATATVTITVNGASVPAASPNSAPYLYIQSQSIMAGNGPALSTSGYSVAEDGELTRIAGFPIAMNYLGSGPPGEGVVSGRYLFAGDVDGQHLDTYLINADGSLSEVQVFDDMPEIKSVCSDCTVGGPVMADMTGRNLYVFVNSCNCDSFSYLQTFSIDPSTGALTYVSSDTSTSGISGFGFVPQAFSADDLYLYGSAGAYGLSGITFLSRSPDGSLPAYSNFGPAVLNPPAPPQGVSYGGTILGADSTGHLAGAILSYQNADQTNLPALLASFTINPDGSLTLTNSIAEMPEVFVSHDELAGALSPDSTLLAAGGDEGIQIFNFNGAAPITPSSALFAIGPIWQIRWDNRGHVFALGSSAMYGPTVLHVFDVTAQGANEAPGSPYAMPGAVNIVVQQ